MSNDSVLLERLRRWNELQEGIEKCQECCKRWPTQVVCPLAAGEIPAPPERIHVLFVGVAPTAQEGKNNGTHFYSAPSDQLRLALFQVLSDKPFALSLQAVNWKDAINRFLEAGLFFVHAAKIRPIKSDSPPAEVIQFCAKQHLLMEIEALSPLTVCILSKMRVGPLTPKVFGKRLGPDPAMMTLGKWRGYMAVAPQPVRGKSPETKAVLRRLWVRPTTARMK